MSQIDVNTVKDPANVRFTAMCRIPLEQQNFQWAWEKAKSEGRLMGDLINDLLDLARNHDAAETYSQRN